MMLIVGLELGEVEVVVEDLAGIIEDGALGFGDNLLQWHGLELRSGNEFIEVIDIGLQVLGAYGSAIKEKMMFSIFFSNLGFQNSNLGFRGSNLGFQ